jgi:hypothetical protein
MTKQIRMTNNEGLDKKFRNSAAIGSPHREDAYLPIGRTHFEIDPEWRRKGYSNTVLT